ncbi:MAG: hypothetical protein HS116_25010 [Planctomycetes bacterium]|nr:hypothetical protein [Planctomycetota bacterium]
MSAKKKLVSAIEGRKRVELTAEEIQIIEHRREHGVLPVSETLQGRRKLDALQRKLADSERERKESIAMLDAAEERMGFVDEVRGNQGAVVVPTFHLPPTKASDEVAPILQFSDWHLEERVDPETINGLNEFNPEIASTRVRRAFERGLFLIERLRVGTKVDTCVVALLGDMITGYIHEELQESNWLSPSEATILAMNLIEEGLNFLDREGNFKRILVPCSIGNHGRTTEKIRISTAHKNSYEWLMYKMLESKFAGNPRIKFQVSNGYHNWINLFGFPIRMHHGDAIRYKDGVGGPTIPIMKKISRWDHSQKAHLDLFGHLHEHIAHNKFIMNGSLIGYNAYGQKMGCSYSVPQQTLVIIDKRFGRQAVVPIYLERSKEIRHEEREAVTCRKT